MGVGVVGLDFQGLAEMCDRLVNIFLTGQCQGKVVFGQGVAGFDVQRRAVVGDGLAGPPETGQRGPPD